MGGGDCLSQDGEEDRSRRRAAATSMSNFLSSMLRVGEVSILIGGVLRRGGSGVRETHSAFKFLRGFVS